MISWQNQWELFAPNFKNGKATVDLGFETSPVSLYAGPGFGDGSHPTTQLMLQAMKKHVPGKTVIDIGCGCGILSFAAVHMGAKKVYGIDIDLEALAHAEKNKALNLYPEKIVFGTHLPAFAESVVILMNMIPAEQELAWGAQKALHPIPKTILTSGVLEERRDEYLRWAQRSGWALSEEISLDQWLQLTFS